jgi:glutathione S-transferase
MRQPRQQARLASEAGSLIRPRVVEQLDGHGRGEPLVVGAPDLTGPARPQALPQPVTPANQGSRPHEGMLPATGVRTLADVLLHDNPRSSNAQKVRFLLAELALPYERREVPFGVSRPAWHRAINPVGGIPALVDGDVRLAESNAILRYLAVRAGRDDLHPAQPAERARVDWLLDATGMTLRPLLRELDAAAFGWRPGRGVGAEAADPAEAEAVLERIAPALADYAALLDDGSPWAALGRFTLADVAGAPFLHRLRRSGLDLATHAPRLAAWGEVVCTRPAWQPVAAEAGV